MTYVIGPDCLDVNDKACVDVCPVDCIYEGERRSYINPNECIDCGACEVECPVAAIFDDRKARGHEVRTQFVADALNFFQLVLPGRTEPLGNPGGARKVGDVGIDTPFSTGYSTS